jgi:transaldolase
MPTPTANELTNTLNNVQDAIKKLQSIQKGVTSNPNIDEHIGKAYSELSQAAAKLNTETTLL